MDGQAMLLKVLLDTVVAHPPDVRTYLASITDRDGARDHRYRLWEGEVQVGQRGSLRESL